jgi:hypothetical protein
MKTSSTVIRIGTTIQTHSYNIMQVQNMTTLGPHPQIHAKPLFLRLLKSWLPVLEKERQSTPLIPSVKHPLQLCQTLGSCFAKALTKNFHVERGS